MTILQYETRVSSDGLITLPPIPEYQGRRVVIRVEEEWNETVMLSEHDGKTPEQDFLDFCETLNMPNLSDADVERIKYERLKEKYQ